MNDLQALAPVQVTVFFPQRLTGVLQQAPYSYVVTLASLALTEYVPTVGGPPNQNLLSTAVVQIPQAGGTPSNNTEMSALAVQMATDYYRWLAASRLDVRYIGVAAWTPEGADDIEFRQTRYMSGRLDPTEWIPGDDEMTRTAGWRGRVFTRVHPPNLPQTILQAGSSQGDLVTTPVQTLVPTNGTQLTGITSPVVDLNPAGPVTITGVDTTGFSTNQTVTFSNTSQYTITMQVGPVPFIVPPTSTFVLVYTGTGFTTTTTTLVTFPPGWTNTSTTVTTFPQQPTTPPPTQSTAPPSSSAPLPTGMQNVGPGDGAKTAFPLPFTPVADWPGGPCVGNVYVDGVPQPPSAYTITAGTPTLTMGVAPANTKSVYASYYMGPPLAPVSSMIDGSGSNSGCSHVVTRTNYATIVPGSATYYLNLALTTQSNDLIVVFVATPSSANFTPTSVTWGGYSLTAGPTTNDAGGTYQLRSYYLLNTAALAGNVAIQWTSTYTTSTYVAQAIVFRNAGNGGWTFNTSKTNSATSNSTTVSSAGASCNLGVAAVIDAGSSGTPTWNASYNRIARPGPSYYLDSAWLQGSGANAPGESLGSSVSWGEVAMWFTT